MPRRTARARHIEQRHNTYFATLDVPKAVRPIIGKRRYVQSLKTQRRDEAERRAPVLVARWKVEIEKARETLGLRDTDPTAADARFWREAIRSAESDEAREAIRDHIADLAIDMDDRGDTENAERFHGLALGKIVPTVEHIDEWIATLDHIQPKTRDMRKVAAQRLAGRFPTLDMVTRKGLAEWALELARGDNSLSRATVQRLMSDCRGYWRYLQTMEIVPEEARPFENLNAGAGNGKAKAQSMRLPFTPEEVVALHKGAKARKDQILADLIELGMWTGCRIEELCSLSVDKVKLGGKQGGVISIEDAKTAAGWREVPVHTRLVPTLKRLQEASTDGFVLSGLSATKYDDRSNAVGKRFGRLKAGAGFGPQHVFHSIRKTVITILENAGVPEGVVADMVGHEKQTMTYGLYSGGASLDTKRKAILKLRYP